MKNTKTKTVFTKYEKTVIVLLAIVQFTVILDFMVMAPLGDMLMKTMHLQTHQFGTAVSAYAFSAGVSGLLAAGFADKYDRKKLLLFFYVGFMLGTLVCGLATTYHMLLAGRILTGLFAGVLGSAAFAIIADLFDFQHRGRVMGFVQMAFAGSQVLGIPAGLFLANNLGWEAPFLLIVAISLLTVLAIMKFMKPVTRHMELKEKVNPVTHLAKTVANRFYILPFLTTALLSIGGFMMMPFSTPFVINNLLISQADLPKLYVITGIGSMVIMPLVGKLSDTIGKLPTFLMGTVIAMVMVVVFTNLSPIPLWQLIVVNIVMFAGIMSRMVPSQALMTAIPEMQDRGAFMSINSSLQQIAGGIASMIATVIIAEGPSHTILHFNTLGYVCIGIMVICAFLMFIINRQVAKKLQHHAKPKMEMVA
jgi:predicted MFS family arabinose efflux permease